MKPADLLRKIAPPVPKVPPSPGEQSANAGWIVLGVGTVMSLIPGVAYSLLIFGGPFILAAFVMSIVAMARGAVSSGIVLLISSILAPVLWLAFWSLVMTFSR